MLLITRRLHPLPVAPVIPIAAATVLKNSESNGAHAQTLCRHVDIVRKLLTMHDNIGVNSASDCNADWTALRFATHNGRHVDGVCELLKHENKDMNACCQGGYTALHLIRAYGRVDIVCELLKDENIDVNASDCNGRAFQWGMWQ